MKTYFFVLLAAGIILLASCRKKPSNPVDDASAQQISSSQPSDTPAESLREVTEPVAEAEHAMPPQPHPETQPAPIAQAGQPAPDFDLPRLTFEIQPDGSILGKLSSEMVKLSSFKGKMPVFLIFSSYTWPPFRRHGETLERLYVSYGEKAEFFLIYISEAHPEMTKADGQAYGKTESTDERAILAQKCMTEMKLSIPVLIDSMEGQAEKAYRGRPDRIAVIDVNGNVAYYGERGPRGFKPLEAEKALQSLLKEQP